MKPANFKVTDKDGNSQFITKVDFSEDKKTATLTFVDKFAKDASYTVVTSGVLDADGEEVKSSTDMFKYEAAAVAKVEFTQTTIKPNQKLSKYVKVTDTLGRDVSGEYTVSFESSNESVVNTTTGETGAGSGSAIVVAKVTDGDKTIKTSKTTVTVSAAAPTDYVGYNIYTGTNTVGTTEKFEKLTSDEKTLSVFEDGENQKLAVYYTNQYGGKDVAAIENFNTSGKPSLTNLTPSVVIVDNDGKINPISVGEGFVRVKQGDVEQTIKIEVKKASAIASLEVPASATVITGKTTSVTPTFKDQYGNKTTASANANVTVTPADASIATAKYEDGKVKVTGVKEGSTTIKVEYKKGDVTLTKTMDVKVDKAGALAEYKAVAGATKLDVSGTNGDDTKTPKSTIVTVNELDANGNILDKTRTDVTLTEVDAKGVAITDADKKKLTIAPGTSNDRTVTAKEDGTAYVQVKVGSLVVDTLEFTVVNSEPVPTTISFNRYDLLINDGLTIAEDGTVSVAGKSNVGDQLESIIKVVDQNGAEIADQNLDITFATANADGITINKTTQEITKITKASSTVDVVVTSVKAAGESKELLNAPVTVKLAVKAPAQTATLSATAITNVDKNPSGINDILTQPNGSYSVAFGINGITNGTEADFKKLESLKVELKKDDTILATNKLQPEKVTNWKYAPTPFNIGRTTVDNQWAWERGVWNGATTVVPNKATVTYVINGITYSKDISATPSQATGYAADDVAAAKFVVDNYDASATADKIQQDLRAKDDKYSTYVIAKDGKKVTIKSEGSTTVATVNVKDAQ